MVYGLWTKRPMVLWSVVYGLKTYGPMVYGLWTKRSMVLWSVVSGLKTMGLWTKG